ncbi:MAG: diguanylate cyclase [Caldisericaceae bacterium]
MKDKLSKELEVITKASKLAQNSEQLKETLKTILLMAKDAFNVGNGAILINNKGKLNVFVSIGYTEESFDLTFDISKAEGVTGLAANKRKIIIVNDTTQDIHYIKGVVGAQSEMAIPIVIKKNVVGVLNFESPEKNAFSESDAANAQALATIIGYMITSFEIDLKLESVVNRLEALIKSTNYLSKASSNLSKTLSAIIKVLEKYFGYKYFDILLKDKDGFLVPMKTSRDFPIQVIKNFKANINEGQGLTGTAARLGQVVCVNDVSKDKRYIPAIKGIKSEIVLPIETDQGIIGVLDIEDIKKDVFSEETIRLLKVLSTEIGIAITNARLYETTRALATTDELTQIANYRFFRQMLDREIARSKRYKKEFSLVMFDIDYFKHYNDTNGHDQGNIALKTVGEILSNLSRTSDLPARFGGEEFIVILPETTKEQADQFANRVRREIAMTKFKGESHQPNRKLTVSGGIASFPHDGKTASEIIKAVDIACYEAKDKGRNRIVAFNAK